MTTVTFQNGRKLIFSPIYFANKFGDPHFLHQNTSLVQVINGQVYEKFCISYKKKTTKKYDL